MRLTGQERYFRGTLDSVKSARDLDPDFVVQAHDHWPSVWQEQAKKTQLRPMKDFKTVFFIRSLREEIQPPDEVKSRRPPQGPVYVDLGGKAKAFA